MSLAKEARWTKLEWGALLLVAIVHVIALRDFETTSWSRHPMVDAYVYWDQAKQLIAGGSPFEEGLYQPPGYPLFLWLVSTVVGEASLHAVRVCQLLLGMGTCMGILVLARRLCLGRGWPGALAVLIYGLLPSTVLFAHDLLTPTLTNACLVGALVLLWKDAATVPLSAVRLALAGMLLGAACIVHPTYLLAVFVLFAWAWSAKQVAPTSLVSLVLGVVLVLGPTTVKNARQFGVLELVSHNAGVNLFLGNNPAWRDTSFLPAGLPFRKLVLEAEPDRRNLAQRNQYWKERTWEGIAEYPVAWMGTMATKTAWSFNNTEIPRNEDYRCRLKDGSPLSWLEYLPVRYAWVFPFGLMGMLGVLRAGGKQRWLPALWCSLHLPVLLFVVADRYRLATWPLLALLVPLGVEALVRGWQTWNLRWKYGLLGVGLLGALVPWLPIDSRTQMDEARCVYGQGHMAAMEQDYDSAKSLYRKVLELRQGDVSAHYWLGKIAYKEQRYKEGIAHVTVVVDEFPGHFPSVRMLAKMMKKTGDLDGAVRMLDMAYRVPGNRTSTGVDLVGWMLEAGQGRAAQKLVDQDPALANHASVKKLLREAGNSGSQDARQ